MSPARGLPCALLLLAAVATAPVARAAAQAPAGGTIAGRVTDAASGLPIVGATVRVVSGDTTHTDEGGRFRFARVAPGAHAVVVNALNYRARRVEASADAGAPELLIAMQATPLGAVEVVQGRQPKTVIDVAAQTTVITREAVESHPGRTYEEQVEHAPGAQVARTGLVSGMFVSRGFSNAFSGAMLVLVDGRFAFVPSLRSNTAFLVPTLDEDIDHIEVAAGPNAALYGPNSANGVVQIVTRSPFDSESVVSVGAGGRDMRRAALRTAGSRRLLGGRIGLKVAGQYFEGTDWPYRDPAEPEGARGNDAVRRWTGETRLAWMSNGGGTTADVAFGRTNAGRATEITGVGAAEARDWRYDYYQARLRRGRFAGQLFLNTSDAGQSGFLRTGQRIRDESRLLAGQLQYGATLAGTDLLFGADAQSTDPRTFGTLDGRNEDHDRIRAAGGYLHTDTHLGPRWELFAGARVDVHDEIRGAVLSPRLAVSWAVRPRQHLWAGVNSAYETPTTNNLFFDFLAGQAGPYGVRTAGVPSTGFHFRRDCGGALALCMKSPFAPDRTVYMPADATLLWPVVVAAMRQQGVDLSRLPAPTAADVGTVLRTLDPTSGTFASVAPGDVRDIARLQPTITRSVEVGYKAELWKGVSVSASAYRERKRNFVGPLLVETPNVFLETSSLAAYLAHYMPADTAQLLAAAIGGLPGTTNAAAKGIPVGAVVPDAPLTGGPDLVLTYRNYGRVNLWGGDVGVEASVLPQLTLIGSYAYVNTNYFPRARLGGLADLALNAPASKGTLGARFLDDRRGVYVDVRTRFIEGFPVSSGVYHGRVASYQVADAAVGYRLPAIGTRLTLTADNLFDVRHREFVGAPTMGRLLFAQVTQTF